MPRYLVQAYVSAAGIEDARLRAIRTAELGDGVVHMRTTYIPSDETALHMFKARSAEAVRRAGVLAELRYERIVEAVEDADVRHIQGGQEGKW